MKCATLHNAAFAFALLAVATTTGCSQIDELIAQLPTPAPTTTAVPTVVATPAPIATTTSPSTTEVCTGAQRAQDGSGGFLWKNGDQTKKITVLLPGKFAKADRVTVFGTRGKPENLSWAGYGNPDSAGDRQHFRGSKPTGAYVGKVEVFTGDSACVYTFKNMPRVD